MANKTVTGIKAVKSQKTGKVGYTVFFTSPFTDYDVEHSEVCEGMSCGNVFTYKDYNLKPGDVVDMRYEPGYEGKAQLTDIVMIKPAMSAEKK